MADANSTGVRSRADHSGHTAQSRRNASRWRGAINTDRHAADTRRLEMDLAWELHAQEKAGAAA